MVVCTISIYGMYVRYASKLCMSGTYARCVSTVVCAVRMHGMYVGSVYTVPMYRRYVHRT